MWNYLPGFFQQNMNMNTLMNQFLNYQANNQQPEVISQYIINQLNKYIALIEHNNKFTSCFFFESDEKNGSDSNQYYLCTSSNFIPKKSIENKEKINIDLGNKYLGTISIQLNIQQRKIWYSNLTYEFIFIQVFPEMDKIPIDKFLTIKKGDLNEYIGGNYKKVYLVGYEHYIRKEIFTIENKFMSLKDNYKMKIDPEENDFLGCSPICIINQNETKEQNKYKIIGIRGQYDILKDNSGYLIGSITESLKVLDLQNAPNQLFDNIIDGVNNNTINEDNAKNEIIISTKSDNNINIDTNIKTDDMQLLQSYYFYTFKEYKTHVIKFHNLISKYYVSQMATNFTEYYAALVNYLNNYPAFVETNKEFLDKLKVFKSPNKFKDSFPSEMIKDFNKILSSGKLELIEKFSYFIAGIMWGLYTYATNKHAVFINNGNQLYKRINLNYEDIKRFESNKDKIILFKNFLNEITTLEHLQGKLYQTHIDSKFVKKSNKFDTKIYIEHVFNEYTWKPTCFSLSTILWPEKVFTLFSFFKVLDVVINYDKKEAEVSLMNVGRNAILEENIAELNNNFQVNYDEDDNIIDVF